MATIRSLKAPPIVEAVIDLRCNVPSGTTPDDAERVAQMLRTAGDTIKRRDKHSTKLKLDKDSGFSLADGDHDFESHVLTSADASDVVQVRRDGVVASQVRKYEGWGQLELLARRAYDAFASIVHPTAVVRVGVRYINRIQLPTTLIDLDDYFTCGPRIPDGLPDHVLAFEHRTVVEDRQSGTKALVMLASAQREPGDRTPFTLDIDVFRNGTFEPTFESIVTVLSALHDLKNRAFFGSLHERALEEIA